mgnify:FL=1
MPFQKGQSGNPAGRPKGSENKVSTQKRMLFLAIMEGQVEHIEDSLDRIRTESDEKYIKALTGLLPYFMPKQQEVSVEVNEAPPAPSWFADIATGDSDASWLVDE